MYKESWIQWGIKYFHFVQHRNRKCSIYAYNRVIGLVGWLVVFVFWFLFFYFCGFFTVCQPFLGYVMLKHFSNSFKNAPNVSLISGLWDSKYDQYHSFFVFWILIVPWEIKSSCVECYPSLSFLFVHRTIRFYIKNEFSNTKSHRYALFQLSFIQTRRILLQTLKRGSSMEVFSTAKIDAFHKGEFIIIQVRLPE